MGGVYEGHQRRVMTAALELIFGAQIQEQDCQKMENLSKTQTEVYLLGCVGFLPLHLLGLRDIEE